jgi:hypothetical protein
MAKDKTSLRERFKADPVLKKCDWVKLPDIVTRSDLQNLLFNNGKPNSESISVNLFSIKSLINSIKKET